jgi:hypothetical protein
MLLLGIDVAMDVSIYLENRLQYRQRLNVTESHNSHYLVDGIHWLVQELRNKYRVTNLVLRWVPGHAGQISRVSRK